MDSDAIKALHKIAHPLVRVREQTETEPAVVLRPAEYRLESLEPYQAAPNRIKHRADLASEQSFIDYVERFALAATSIYIGPASFRAVIDHHAHDEVEGEDEPAWGDHVATYTPEQSLQWQAWAAQNKQYMKQIDFAYWLEERLQDIADPKANEVYKAALDFQQHQHFTVQSAPNLDTGEVKFNLTRENKSGTVKFPQRFTLEIPVYENQPPEQIDCRFRYRVNDGGVLTLWYQFVRDPAEILRESFKGMSDRLQSNFGGQVHFYYAKQGA